MVQGRRETRSKNPQVRNEPTKVQGLGFRVLSLELN